MFIRGKANYCLFTVVSYRYQQGYETFTILHADREHYLETGRSFVEVSPQRGGLLQVIYNNAVPCIRFSISNEHFHGIDLINDLEHRHVQPE